jgi:transposase
MRYGTRTQLKRRWTPCGHRPRCPVKIGYEFGYLYTAINPYSGDVFCLMLPSMSKECFAVFLQEFLRYSQLQPAQQSLMILDGAGSHHADELPRQDWFELKHLPAAAPELNPVERFFKELRRDLANQVFATIEEVQQRIINSLQRYWLKPKDVSSLTRFPYLDPHQYG